MEGSANMKFALFTIGLCLMAGFIGSFFTTPNLPWYDELDKPAFNPPSWLFGPVWTLLYVLMGVSLYLVIGKTDLSGYVIFGVQLIANTLWSLIFFSFQDLPAAFLWIILLWIAIALTIWKFYKADKRAAYLLIPYILWVSFATLLNYYLWMLN
jgi:translocator protein